MRHYVAAAAVVVVVFFLVERLLRQCAFRAVRFVFRDMRH